MYQLGRFLRWAIPLAVVIALAVFGFRSCANNPPTTSAPAATQEVEEEKEVASVLQPAEEVAPAEEPAEVEDSALEVEQVVEEFEVATVVTGDFPEDLLLTPVDSTDSFSSESAWLISEPGVLLDATATFDRGSSTAEHYVQCPEGGFSYFSAGQGKISMESGLEVNLESGEGVNNLVLIRCRISDGLQDTDLNVTAQFSGYKPGNVITSPMPLGAYVSKNWFRQQLEASSGITQSGGNCGASGCSKTYIHLLDIDSGFYQEFLVEKANIEIWNQIK